MKAEASIRLMIVDDHYVVRIGLRAILGMEEDLSVVAEAADSSSGILVFRETQPDVTLMDIRMPGGGGVELTARICAEFPGARIIMLTTFDGDEDIYRALEAGASGYLLKDAPADELLDAIRKVHAGERYLPEDVARRLAERDPASTLTQRELSVLELVTKGLQNRDISRLLGISENTTKFHLRQIFTKLGVADRTEATRAAMERGILHLG
ncbi:MAG TPA: response regulator transcription factor [Chthoniobacteraceae bacterium]|jgi:two-component system NarL family response regulator